MADSHPTIQAIFMDRLRNMPFKLVRVHTKERTCRLPAYQKRLYVAVWCRATAERRWRPSWLTGAQLHVSVCSRGDRACTGCKPVKKTAHTTQNLGDAQLASHCPYSRPAALPNDCLTYSFM